MATKEAKEKIHIGEGLLRVSSVTIPVHAVTHVAQVKGGGVHGSRVFTTDGHMHPSSTPYEEMCEAVKEALAAAK